MTVKRKMNDVGPTIAPDCCLKNSFQVSLQEGEHRQNPVTSQCSRGRNQSSGKLKQLKFVEKREEYQRGGHRESSRHLQRKPLKALAEYCSELHR